MQLLFYFQTIPCVDLTLFLKEANNVLGEATIQPAFTRHTQSQEDGLQVTSCLNGFHIHKMTLVWIQSAWVSRRSGLYASLLLKYLNKCPLFFFFFEKYKKYTIENESHSVLSYSLRSRGLYSPWDFPGQNTGVSSCSLLQGIFPTQGMNPSLPHFRWIL